MDTDSNFQKSNSKGAREHVRPSVQCSVQRALWCAGDRGDLVLILQERVPQQGDVLHDAADRGEVQPGRAREHHCATLLDHQAPAQGSLLGRIVPCTTARAQANVYTYAHADLAYAN